AVLRDRMEDAAARWTGRAHALRTQVTPPNPNLMMSAFKTWVEADLNDNEYLRVWLLSLPPEGLRALTVQIARFCADLNIDLNWLLSGDLALEPHVEAAVADIVTDYCQACLNAIRIQGQLETFQNYQTRLSEIVKKDQQTVGQALLTQLRDENLVPPTAADLLLASDEECREYALHTIRNAAERDREKFKRIWASVVPAEETPVV
ncbi:MAG: hypothetical protein GYB67_13330, partial [Chloroflexi bacterium]|nr:hypothetical protein [Chloroflexota bacterium]